MDCCSRYNHAVNTRDPSVKEPMPRCLYWHHLHGSDASSHVQLVIKGRGIALVALSLRNRKERRLMTQI